VSELKRTPLYPLYEEYGAKTVDFSGWEMPVQFQSIIQEHEAVRTRVGLFDVSHMGEFEVSGPGAGAFLQEMVTNDVSKLEPGRALYSPMVYPHGGTVDDLLVYCFTPTRFLVVVNAGNIEKDYDWLANHARGRDLTLIDRSPEVALLALQGPLAETVLQRLTDTPLSAIRPYRFCEGRVAGVQAILSRTGYTGEDGFELYVSADDAHRLWRSLLAEGRPEGILPCGLGARDTLRLEAALPLYGHELDEQITPLEAGLGRFVKLDKGEFVGREALQRQKETGVTRKLVGLRVAGRGIPRAGQTVLAGESAKIPSSGQPESSGVVGHVTSGTMSPTLKQGIGLALVNAAHTEVGESLFVDIRGKAVAAEVVETPFYRRPRATAK
jgi:aminomethyltransferase